MVRTLLHSPTISAPDNQQIFVEKFSELQNSNVPNGKDENPENVLLNSIYSTFSISIIFINSVSMVTRYVHYPIKCML